jgi:hypothetical protein
MPTDPKPFLEYLDKEMTIMGILSAFCVAVLALVVDKIAGAKDSTFLSTLWGNQANVWVVGSAALLVAALLFYRQRSHLAWYYGQITFAQVVAAKGNNSVEAWLKAADSWEAWLYYREGFVGLSLGFFQFSIAVVQHQLNCKYPLALTLLVPLAGCVSFTLLQRLVLTRYRFHDHPWIDWRKRVKARKD